MDLGTGIYSSTVLVLLAISVWQITKHKKWKLFGKVCAGLAAVCALVVGVGYLWEYASTRPKPVTEFEGVKLGASITDVTVALGAPSKVDVNRLHFDEKKLFADFTAGKQRSLIRLCAYGAQAGLMDFNIASTESEIIKILGQPSKISVSGDGLTKVLNYKKWNASFGISANLLELTCMASEPWQFKSEITPADLSKLDLNKLVPPSHNDAAFDLASARPVAVVPHASKDASTNIPDTNGELADPCAPDLSRAERKRRLSKFGTIRETGLGTYEAGAHRLVLLSDSTVISCE